MSKISAAVFTDESEPLGTITINGVDYDVFPPNLLEEKFYIQYFAARAEIMDVLAKYTPKEGDSEAKRNANSQRMDAEMVRPARNQVEALLQQPKNSLSLLPSTVIKVYNAIEDMIQAHQEEQREQEQEEPDVPQPSKQSNKAETMTKKNSSKST